MQVADIAPRIIEWHVIQATRVVKALDDAVSNI
jgi:hypothetical protein